MREIRLHGSEGGGTELNRSFLPLSMMLGFEFGKLFRAFLIELMLIPARSRRTELGGLLGARLGQRADAVSTFLWCPVRF